MKLQSSFRNSKKLEFQLSDLISFLLLYLFVSLSIVNDLGPFRNPVSETGCKDTHFFETCKFIFNFFHYFRKHYE